MRMNFFQLYNTADFTEVNHFLPVDIKLIFDHEKKWFLMKKKKKICVQLLNCVGISDFACNHWEPKSQVWDGYKDSDSFFC